MMNFDTWTWVLLIVILAFCVVPMLFMRRRGNGKRPSDAGRTRGADDDRPS